MGPPERDYDPDYLTRKAQLPGNLRLELELIEERIITDPTRTYQREYGDDGVIYDTSGYDEFGFTVAYLPIDGVFRFVGFTLDP